jgi:inosine/xanthosine triphosphate pyrophosphatase family protein
MLYFITGNKNKLAEVRAILGEEVGHLDIDLPEIQEIDYEELMAVCGVKKQRFLARVGK